MLTAKLGDSGYLTSRSQSGRFPLGTTEKVSAAGGYVIYQLGLFDVDGVVLLPINGVVAYWLAEEVLVGDTIK